MTRQICYARIEGGKPPIRGLALRVAVINLLDDDGDLEDGEDLVIPDAGEVSSRPLRVPMDDLVAGEEARTIRHRRERVALLGRRGRRPIGEHDAEIDERIAKRAHLPVEHRDNAARILRID